MPNLRIVADEVWFAAKKAQEAIRASARGRAGLRSAEVRFDLNATHRPKFLLSGLLKCSECGGNYVASGKDRLSCATRRTRGTCKSKGSITRQSIEDRVLVGLKQRLVTPELAAAFVLEFQAEYERLRSQSQAIQAENSRKIAHIDRKIQGLMVAIEDGLYKPEMKKRMEDLSEERERLSRARQSGDVSEKLILHPRMHELYVRKIGQLEVLLAGSDH